MKIENLMYVYSSQAHLWMKYVIQIWWFISRLWSIRYSIRLKEKIVSFRKRSIIVYVPEHDFFFIEFTDVFSLNTKCSKEYRNGINVLNFKWWILNTEHDHNISCFIFRIFFCLSKICLQHTFSCTKFEYLKKYFLRSSFWILICCRNQIGFQLFVVLQVLNQHSRFKGSSATMTNNFSATKKRKKDR